MKLFDFIQKNPALVGPSNLLPPPARPQAEDGAASTALAVQERLGLLEVCNRVVTSRAFLAGLSDEIGEPGQRETRDEFVNRAAGILRKRLVAALTSGETAGE